MRINNKFVVILLITALCVCAFGCATEPVEQQTAQTTTVSPTDEFGYLVLPEAEFVYNSASSGTSVSYKEPLIQFEEPLDADEISAITPDDRFPCSGTARWDGEGNLAWINLEVTVGEETVTVYYPFVYYAMGSLLNTGTDPEPTEINGHAFEVAELAYTKNIGLLNATCVLEDQYMIIFSYFKTDRRPVSQPAFETVVRWMSLLREKPDFSIVQYSEIPETGNDSGQ